MIHQPRLNLARPGRRDNRCVLGIDLDIIRNHGLQPRLGLVLTLHDPQCGHKGLKTAIGGCPAYLAAPWLFGQGPNITGQIIFRQHVGVVHQDPSAQAGTNPETILTDKGRGDGCLHIVGQDLEATRLGQSTQRPGILAVVHIGR